MSVKTKPKTHGTAILTCQDHPNLRWRQTKYNLPEVPRRFGGDGVLTFLGEEGGKPGCYFNESEAEIKAKGSNYETWYREQWTVECSCLEAALVFVKWAN